MAETKDTQGVYKGNKSRLLFLQSYLLEHTDGIKHIPALPESVGAIYNLAGQRLTAPRKGINIINRKKILQ